MSFKQGCDTLRIYARGILLTLALAALNVGCGAEDSFEGNELVALEKIPAPAMDAAKKAVPGITFNKAYKARIDGQDAFEIVGKTANGKTREVEVTGAGKVLNIE